MEIAEAAAVVTGGASGLGEASVRRLLKSGARVAIVDRDADKGKALAAELGSDAVFAQADVTDETQVAGAVEAAAQLGPLRIAINCAGVGWAGRTINRDGSPHPLGMFETVLRINLIGTFNVIRIAAVEIARQEPLVDGERGVIVNTSSVAAYDGQIGQIAYSASKGAVVAMTLPAARDLAAVGIRVNTICPGTFDTPLLGLMPESGRQALAANVPFPKRLGNAAEFGDLVEAIARNSYLNAEVIRLDGAIRMPPK